MGAISKKQLVKGQRSLMEKPGATAQRRNGHGAAMLWSCPRPQETEHRQGKDGCPNAGQRDRLADSRARKPADSVTWTAAST